MQRFVPVLLLLGLVAAGPACSPSPDADTETPPERAANEAQVAPEPVPPTPGDTAPAAPAPAPATDAAPPVAAAPAPSDATQPRSEVKHEPPTPTPAKPAPAPPPVPAAPAPVPSATPLPTPAATPPTTSTDAALAVCAEEPVAVAPGKPGLTRIGADKCKTCHRVQYASWAASAHAKCSPPLDCEGCHGPGSEYKSLAVMKDAQKSREAGLVDPTPAFCREHCHFTGWQDDMPARAHDHKTG